MFFITGFIQPKLSDELNQKLNNIVEKNWFHPSQFKCYTDTPLEFYSGSKILKIGMHLSMTELEHKLRIRSYRKNLRLKAINKNRLKPGWFISLNKSDCYKNISLRNRVIAQDNCLIWRDSYTQHIYHAGFTRDSISVLQQNFTNSNTISLHPFLFAQYEGGEPVFKKCTPFNTFPLYCALAVQAAEDHNFVIHKGISKKGILRAIWKNIQAGKIFTRRKYNHSAGNKKYVSFFSKKFAQKI